MPRSTTLGLLALVGLVLIAGIFMFGQNTSTGSCSKNGAAQTVVIQNGRVSDTNIHAPLCSRLTIVNKDHVTREIAFGAHDDHVPYDGVAEKILNQNQRFTVTLDQIGRFHWHDHEHDEVHGYFTVSR